MGMIWEWEGISTVKCHFRTTLPRINGIITAISQCCLAITVNACEHSVQSLYITVYMPRDCAAIHWSWLFNVVTSTGYQATHVVEQNNEIMRTIITGVAEFM